MNLNVDKTARNFSIVKFQDQYGQNCSLQKSSLATEDAIWFGTDVDKLVIFENENMGKYIETDLPKTFSVNSRMHLTQSQVKELLPLLQKFAETGDL